MNELAEFLVLMLVAVAAHGADSQAAAARQPRAPQSLARLSARDIY
jgi:hypothetical protein